MFQTQNGITYGYDIEVKYDPILKARVKRLLQLFPGMGCVPWLRTKAACCPFCRLPAGTRLAVLGEGHEAHFDPWEISDADYVEMIDQSFAAARDVETVACFNGGSFLTDREIPKTARSYLYNQVARHPTAKGLLIESRPEFIQDDMLAEAEAQLGGKALTVAIGLESTTDQVRNGPLAKFIGRKSFLSAVKRLQDRGHKTFVYVFLGAPGLSASDALADAQKSIDELAELGVDQIALSCAFVPPGGPLEDMYTQGEFRPPYLWSIAQLVDHAQRRSIPLSLGGFDDFPPPVAIPHNCGACDGEIHEVFDQFRKTNQFDLNSLPDCSCHQDWENTLTT
ncbi:MAG: hypothetical protein JXQ85_07700 [Cognatishimia sp.]|uniref:hypothetical protein n=1 Tax=Cognatishimia sp. TaxID=2211648 RepID=UPI003B8C07B2